MIKGLIFDMDGVLLDSMGHWLKLYEDYLVLQGITDFPPDVAQILNPMTSNEAAAYFISEFHIKLSVPEIIAGVNSLIEDNYRRNISLRPNVLEFLQANRDKKLCIATSTDKHLAEIGLKSHGILDQFEFIITTTEVGVGKTKPDVFEAALRKLGLGKDEVVIFEDSLFAIKAAKSADFYVTGIFDKWSAHMWKEIKEIADECVYNLFEAEIVRD